MMASCFAEKTLEMIKRNPPVRFENDQADFLK